MPTRGGDAPRSAFSRRRFPARSVYLIVGSVASSRIGAGSQEQYGVRSVMNRSELENLLADIESDRVERTISLTDLDKFSEAICSFANDMPNSGKPGYLFIAATPDGKASGAVITDDLLQRLAAIRSDGNIQPLPAMNVQKWSLGEARWLWSRSFHPIFLPCDIAGGPASALDLVVPRRLPPRSESFPSVGSIALGPGMPVLAGKLLSTTWPWISSRSRIGRMPWLSTLWKKTTGRWIFSLHRCGSTISTRVIRPMPVYSFWAKIPSSLRPWSIRAICAVFRRFASR